MSTKDKMSLQEACEFLEVSTPRMHELLRTSVVPGIKLGKSWVIPRAAFMERIHELALSGTESEKEIEFHPRGRGRPRLQT